MRWREGRESENVEDRRAEDTGGGGIRLPMGGMRMGVGTLLVIVVGAWLFGADPLTVLSMLTGGTQTMQVPDAGDGGTAPPPPADDEGAKFVSVVLADTEDVWTEIFSAAGQRYEDPKLVLFTDGIRSACGMAQSAMGPFYCPNDHKVYIDLGFYRELRDRFHAPGEFAQAYVIAHEVGHHVQTLLGTSQKVHDAQQRGSQEQANALSVRLELQADCYAGVWANHANQARHILEQGDVESGLNAAAAIGDDRIQRQTQGTVVPESFTHGSSAQRVGWFKRGLEQGDPDQCDTFGAGAP